MINIVSNSIFYQDKCTNFLELLYMYLMKVHSEVTFNISGNRVNQCINFAFGNNY